MTAFVRGSERWTGPARLPGDVGRPDGRTPGLLGSVRKTLRTLGLPASLAGPVAAALHYGTGAAVGALWRSERVVPLWLAAWLANEWVLLPAVHISRPWRARWPEHVRSLAAHLAFAAATCGTARMAARLFPRAPTLRTVGA